ncbi:MAG: TonB-dependent receptor [Bryobacterales bacterium]|nr:TonB-dependent receptor [Bryobacterales bacterium]
MTARQSVPRLRGRAPLVLVLGMVLSAIPSHAQTGQGVITGSVTDVSGATIPGVAISAVNQETNFTYNAVATEEGIYRIPYMNPGMYRISFSRPGFKALVQSGIQVRSTETARLDVSLSVGEVVERVEVSAGAALLETETSSTGHLVTGKQLNTLPTPQMKIESMLFFVAGVTSQAGNGHAVGGRTRAFQMTNDGVMGTTPGTGQISTARNISTSPHNMEEVKVLTTALPAEYGHSGGGVMSITYKSGTNQFHGLAEERYVQKQMIHRAWQDSRVAPGDLAFHLISGSISGPIIRNKTFFLFGVWRHHENSTNQGEATVPSPEMMAGDFSFPQQIASGGRVDPIYDPDSLVRLADGSYSRTPFAGNIVPQNRFDPVARAFLALKPYTAPNDLNRQTFFNSQGPQNNLYYNIPYTSFRTAFDTKIDHQFSDGHKIFGRWSYPRHRSGGYQPAPSEHYLDYSFPLPIDQNQVVVSDTFTLNPTTVNEMRLGFNRRYYVRSPETVGQGWAKKLGIPNVSDKTFPSFLNGSGGQLYFRFPEGGNVDVNENMSFQENLTFIRGRHTFKAGWEIMRTRHNVSVPAQPSGRYAMAGTEFPFTPNTGHPFASFLLGTVGSAQFTNDLATWLPRWWSNALYFQTDWKATRKLTLNLGVRWQHESPYNTKYGQQSQFDPSATDELTGRRGALLHPKNALARSDRNNFQPRVGLAYNFRSKWVFRGGFAVNTLDLFTNSTLENFDEYTATANIQPQPGNPAYVFKLSQGPPPINFNVRPDGSVPYVGTNYSQRTASYYDPNMRNPYIMNWNGGFQWEFARNLLLDLSYQGSAGVGLLNFWDINQVPLNISSDPVQLEQIRRATQNFKPYPHFGQIRHYSNYGHSTYHGGTIKVEKRLSSGVSFTSFYTFSKSIDQDSDDAQAGGVDFYNRSLEKARSDYDVSHRWVSYWTWQLPFGKNRRWMNGSSIASRILGNWELNGINTLESGAPFGFTHNGNLPGTGANVYLPGTQRPNMAAGKTYDDIRLDWNRRGPCRHIAACIDPWADINAFAIPGSFTPGQSGRNIISGPGLNWQQFSLARVIPVKERFRVTLRFDMNQPFKIPFFSPPSSAVDFRNPQNFGKIRTAQGGFSGLGARTYMHAIVRVEF